MHNAAHMTVEANWCYSWYKSVCIIAVLGHSSIRKGEESGVPRGGILLRSEPVELQCHRMRGLTARRYSFDLHQRLLAQLPCQKIIALYLEI